MSGRFLLLVPLLLPLAACDVLSSLGPFGWERMPGTIDAGSGTFATAEAPGAVQAGTAFTLTVVTWGSGSCTRPGGAQTRVDGLTADVRPFDLKRTRGECTSDLASFPRPVSLTFPAPGTAVIRIHGVDLWDRPVTREIPVTVR